MNGKINIYFAAVKPYLEDSACDVLSSSEFGQIEEEIVHYMIDNNYIDSLDLSRPICSFTPCGSMQNHFAVIGPEGELYRCEHCIGMKEWIVGNTEFGFFRNEADSLFLDNDLPEECNECKLLPVCAGGCIADRILNRFKFDCETYKKRIKTKIKYAVKTKAGVDNYGVEC